MLKASRKLLAPDQVEQEVQRVVKLVSATLNPLAIILFGSAAAGRMTNQSDIDLCLIFKDDNEIKAKRRMIAAKMPLSHFQVDLVMVHESEFRKKRELGGVCFVVAQDGRWLLGSKELLS